MSTLVTEPRIGRSAMPLQKAPARWPGTPAQRWCWVASAVWLLSGVFFVPTDQQAVVTRFGAVSDPRVLPGIHFALPWPVDSVYRLRVKQLQRVIIGGEGADMVLGRSQPLTSQFLTGDQN